MGFPLHIVSGDFAMTKLPAAEPIPNSALSAEVCFVARTAIELSIVAPAHTLAPQGGPGGFRLLGIDMTFGTIESGYSSR
jgi:hypothetical protein